MQKNDNTVTWNRKHPSNEISLYFIPEIINIFVGILSGMY